MKEKGFLVSRHSEGRLITPRLHLGVPDSIDGSRNLLGTKQASVDRTSVAGGERSLHRGVVSK